MNEMRERLLDLIYDVVELYPSEYEKLADYLLDNGVIVLPARIGQTVWIIDEYEILEDVVYEIGYGTTRYGDIRWLFLVEDSGMDFYDSDIGKTVFTTSEAAEAALKARENNAD